MYTKSNGISVILGGLLKRNSKQLKTLFFPFGLCWFKAELKVKAGEKTEWKEIEIFLGNSSLRLVLALSHQRFLLTRARILCFKMGTSNHKRTEGEKEIRFYQLCRTNKFINHLHYFIS